MMDWKQAILNGTVAANLEIGVELKMIPIETKLSGSQIVDRLRKGHMVRRASWVDGFYIRICNERGFDDDGNAIVGDGVAIYTISTEGFFHHVGYSDQPMKILKAFRHSGTDWMVNNRSTEGLQSLFANDWEDYGFISGNDFDFLIESKKAEVRENIEKAEENSIRMAKRKQKHE